MMPTAIINCITATINKTYHLPRKQCTWHLNENPPIQLRAPNRYSLGFSLDNKCNPPFAFFSQSPPEHLAKMCDAIVVMWYRKTLYLFVIEQKTKHKDSYKKQLTNGKYFCDWLLSLCKEYNYVAVDPVYISLLIWEPRECAPRKGETTHRLNGSSKKKLLPLFQYAFEFKNHSDIALQDFIKAL